MICHWCGSSTISYLKKVHFPFSVLWKEFRPKREVLIPDSLCALTAWERKCSLLATCAACPELNNSHNASKCEISAIIRFLFLLHVVPCFANLNIPRKALVCYILFGLSFRARVAIPMTTDNMMFSEFSSSCTAIIYVHPDCCIDMISLVCSLLGYWLNFHGNETSLFFH